MKVSRNFSEIYRTETDPWNIGEANAPRYGVYHDAILKWCSGTRNVILDVGSGFGAFLSRFREQFRTLVAVELSTEAILKGQERFPFIAFRQGDAGRLAALETDFAGRCDAVICSDVINYLTDLKKNDCLSRIADLLAPGGVALIAAWSPGGHYMTPEEFRRLVRRFFVILEERTLDSEHIFFIARKKRRLVGVSIDYETWHPIPPGKNIDWEMDVLVPAERLMNAAEKAGVPLTLMAEMGEHAWLRRHRPTLADKMENQWIDAIKRGHDVQLHLHPNWLPELDPGEDESRMRWDWSKAKIDDYPGDIVRLIGENKDLLERLLTPYKPDYKTTVFRCGAYQAQPFRRLSDALIKNGFLADSSVYAGGVSKERGYDYSLAYSRHQPYFANPYDPQLKSPPSEEKLIELPIFCPRPGERWFLDNEEGKRFADRLLAFFDQDRKRWDSTERFRLKNKLTSKCRDIYARLKSGGPVVNRLIPRPWAHAMTAYGPDTSAGDDFFVMIGHTKSDLLMEELTDGFRRLKAEGRCEFVTVSDMAITALENLGRYRRGTARQEADFQVAREYQAIMGEERNDRQSKYIQSKIPLDRERVLDLGCGAGYWSKKIADDYPWMTVVGVDAGVDFIDKANKKYSGERVSFHTGDFGSLSFPDGRFDLVYADNTLEHAYDVDKTLSEAFRVLSDGGLLLAALPSDARNPSRQCDNHTWKTAPHEVRLRLEQAGFGTIEIEEVDAFRKLGSAPFPPSEDKMMVIRAWKNRTSVDRLSRALAAMNWVHRRLRPDTGQEKNDAVGILAGGHAFCWGYVVALGALLRREGYKVRWISMIASNHPRGRGPKMMDSHEILEVDIDGRPYVFDPMTNAQYPHSFMDLLKDPSKATGTDRPDERYAERGYHLYDTAFWYERVVKYTVRRDPAGRIWQWHRR